MEYEEIKKLSDAELAEKIVGERTMLSKLKLQHGVSPIENPMRVRNQRKLVAKLLTESSARRKNSPPAAKQEPKAVAVKPVKVKAEKAVKVKAVKAKKEVK